MRLLLVVILSIIIQTAGVAFAETVYAEVGGYEVTSSDISYSLGYVPSNVDELKEAVSEMVERYAVLVIAEGKGYAVNGDEINRAAELITKTRGGNSIMPSSYHYEYVRQELVISEYIDDYIYPRVEANEDDLLTLFMLNPYEYMKYPPQGKTALKKVFPKYRNDVLNTYVTLQVGHLLSKEIKAAREKLYIRYHR